MKGSEHEMQVVVWAMDASPNKCKFGWFMGAGGEGGEGEEAEKALRAQ